MLRHHLHTNRDLDKHLKMCTCKSWHLWQIKGILLPGPSRCSAIMMLSSTLVWNSKLWKWYWEIFTFLPPHTGSPDARLAVNKQGALKAAISGAAIKPPWGAMLVCSSSLCIQNWLPLLVSFAVNDYIQKHEKIWFLWAKPSPTTAGPGEGQARLLPSWRIPKGTAGSPCFRRGGCGMGQVHPAGDAPLALPQGAELPTARLHTQLLPLPLPLLLFCSIFPFPFFPIPFSFPFFPFPLFPFPFYLFLSFFLSLFLPGCQWSPPGLGPRRHPQRGSPRADIAAPGPGLPWHHSCWPEILQILAQTMKVLQELSPAPVSSAVAMWTARRATQHF